MSHFERATRSYIEQVSNWEEHDSPLTELGLSQAISLRRIAGALEAIALVLTSPVMTVDTEQHSATLDDDPKRA